MCICRHLELQNVGRTRTAEGTLWELADDFFMVKERNMARNKAHCRKRPLP